MSFSEKGTSLASNLINLGRDVWDDGDSGLTIRREFKTAYSNWLANPIPLGTAHPTVPQCFLRRRQVIQNPGSVKGLCRVVLTFRQESTFVGESPPPDRFTDNGSSVRVSLLASPYYDNLRENEWSEDSVMAHLRAYMESSGEAADRAALAAISAADSGDVDLVNDFLSRVAQGQTEVLASGYTVTKTEFSSTEFSPPNGRVARRENPGAGYGDSGQWLIIGCYRGREGQWYTRNTVYQHSDEAVPELYPEA